VRALPHLSESTLPLLKQSGVTVPRYDRREVGVGVVHFGPGAFHRVHQAYYFDDLLNLDNRWGICEVALQSTGVRDALAPQDGLYTLAILDSSPSMRVIGSAKEFLVARESPEAVLKRLINPATRLITATITEKGYCLTADGSLDTTNVDVQHDLAHPDRPLTFVGYVVEALRQRRANNLSPPNIISCDNLTNNGTRLRNAVVALASTRDQGLATWIANEVAFPCTMVDSITPATDDALRIRVSTALGLEDAWPVQREAFTQWVIEDSLRGLVPDLDSAGVTITNDVNGFEYAKLRLLNGAHSSLAYIGGLAGLETVSQAMTTPALAKFIHHLMQDIRSTVKAPRGLDLSQYIESLQQRFLNPMLPHRLAQIAWDGSQKIPFRLLGTITDLLTSGAPIARLCLPIAAWFHFIRRQALRGDHVVDPLAKQLFAIGNACSGVAAFDVASFLSLDRVFPRALVSSPTFIASLESAYQRLDSVRQPQDLHAALLINS
jgi:fructuronate reductase